MRYDKDVGLALKNQFQGYEFVRQWGTAWLVHLWSHRAPQQTICGERIQGTHRVAGSGGGSVCGRCAQALEDMNFRVPEKRNKGIRYARTD